MQLFSKNLLELFDNFEHRSPATYCIKLSDSTLRVHVTVLNLTNQSKLWMNYKGTWVTALPLTDPWTDTKSKLMSGSTMEGTKLKFIIPQQIQKELAVLLLFAFSLRFFQRRVVFQLHLVKQNIRWVLNKSVLTITKVFFDHGCANFAFNIFSRYLTIDLVSFHTSTNHERCDIRTRFAFLAQWKGISAPGDYSKFTGQNPWRRVFSIKLLCNIVEIALWNRCSPVNLLHIFRTPFYKNNINKLRAHFSRTFKSLKSKHT